MRSNIAAEARAKIVYERLINLTDDPGVREALGFLMTREIAHQKSFEKALYSIEPNFPSGKLPGDPRYVDTYFDLSVGEGNAVGPWNQGEQWNYVSGTEMTVPVDGGEGFALTGMAKDEQMAVMKLAARTKSNLDKDPVTGADLGAGPGAGRTTSVAAGKAARH